MSKQGSVIQIDACEDTSRWKNMQGDYAPAKIEAVSENAKEGDRCIQLTWGRKESKAAAVEFFPDNDFGGMVGISFWLRAEGEGKENWKLRLRSDADSGMFAIAKDIGLNFDGWVRVRLHKQDFAFYRRGKRPSMVWSEHKSFQFLLNEGEGKPTIYIDDICYDPPNLKKPIPDTPIIKKFWWWREPIDRFGAMHLRFGQWPRISEMGDNEIASFSEYMMTPGMPYTLCLRNLKNYSRFNIKISDWNGDTIDTIDLPIRKEDEQTFVQKLDIVSNLPRYVALKAPQKVGTYLFDIDCYDQQGNIKDTYQTGIFVLAKLLSEPRGFWGMHTYLGTKAIAAPHLRWVMNTLSAFGVTTIRERVSFPTTGVAGKIYTHRVREVAEMAHERNMYVVGLMRTDSDKSFDRSAYIKGIAKPGIIRDEKIALKEAYELARDFKGLVDCWEVFNETNRLQYKPYSNTLRVMYKGLKKGNPDCSVTMAGMDVFENWPTLLVDEEKETGTPLSDMLTTHLYPGGATLSPNKEKLYPYQTDVEDQLRDMVHSQDKHLREKGMLMTEGGMPEMDYLEQTMIKDRLLEADFDGEKISQHWYARYGPALLGECLKVGAKLHACCFFRCVASMGKWYYWDPETRVNPMSFFTNHWDTREVVFPRPKAYTLNTLARLLTYDVELVDVNIEYDQKSGNVEQYGFHRPGETILALWVGLHIGMRAEKIDLKIPVPENVGMVLVADNDGNERVLEINNNQVSLQLVRQSASYIRLLEGKREGSVFMQHTDQIPAGAHQLVADRIPSPARKALYDRLTESGIAVENTPGRDCVNIYIGTPKDNPRLLAGIAHERDLPVVSDTVPLPGQPLALYSSAQRALYLVGQTDDDLALALDKILPILNSINSTDPLSAI